MQECIVYLASTGFRQSRVPITLLLIAEVTPGLSTDCAVYVSSKASFTVEFCQAGDSSAQCVGPGGRNVNYGQPVARTNFTDIGDGVILQREIVVSPPAGGGEGGGSSSGSGASSSQLEDSSSSVTDYIVPIILAVLIALVLLLLAILVYCWCKGCFG